MTVDSAAANGEVPVFTNDWFSHNIPHWIDLFGRMGSFVIASQRDVAPHSLFSHSDTHAMQQSGAKVCLGSHTWIV